MRCFARMCFYRSVPFPFGVSLWEVTMSALSISSFWERCPLVTTMTSNALTTIALLASLTVAPCALAGGVPPSTAFSCWGRNDGAQCATPSVANTLRVNSLDAGIGFGVILLSDGTLVHWGDTTFGQDLIPVLAPGEFYTAVSAGGAHGIALSNTGALYGWGWNIFGEATVPVLAPGVTAQLIAAGESHSLASLSDGTIVGWGLNSAGKTTPPLPPVGTSVLGLSGGLDHSAALFSDGTIQCWGDNTDGECDVPALTGIEIYTEVDCGRNFTVALTSFGTVMAWGNAAYTTVPVSPSGSRITRIYAHFVNAAFLTELSDLVVWGDDGFAQTTVPVTAGAYRAVAIGESFVVAAIEADCNDNGVADKDEILIDPTLDCDGDDQLDACQITADPTLDCDDDGALDSCQISADIALDCNGNGQLDFCELRDDATIDCDSDGDIDTCQVLSDPTSDCDGDGTVDSCALQSTGVSSEIVAPFGVGDIVTATGINLALPVLDVRIEATVRADLGSYGEWLELVLNDTIIDYMFVGSGSNCPSAVATEVILIDKDLFIALAPDGDVTLSLRPSAFVSRAECATSQAKIVASWISEGSDCNGNGTPDLCELVSGDVPDNNGDGLPDTCTYMPDEDFNGDGKADIFWKNANGNQMSLWFMNGTTRTSGASINTSPPTGFTFTQLGDFDGDHRTDLMFRNNGLGTFYAYLLEGSTIEESGTVDASTVVSTLKLLGTPDLNGDGRSDMIFKSTVSGDVNAWLMEGRTKSTGGAVSNANGLTFLGYGDLDADGDDDLLWRNSAGVVSGWIMSGLVAVETGDLDGASSLGQEWQAASVGDLDGDGQADLLWRNSGNGQVNAWFLGGLAKLGGGLVNSTLGVNYRVECMADVDGDMMEDIVWRNTQNGDTYIWLMDGLTKRSGAFVKRVSLDWDVGNQ